LIAYRGFAVTNMLEILSLGTIGIALLALNLIFLGGLLAYIHRVFEKWKPIENAMGIVRAGANARKLLREYTRAAIRAAREGDQDHLLDLLDTMEHMATRPDWRRLISEAKNFAVNADRYQDLLNILETLKQSVDHPT
jgi:hypothetical protein